MYTYILWNLLTKNNDLKIHIKKSFETVLKNEYIFDFLYSYLTEKEPIPDSSVEGEMVSNLKT